MKNQERFNKSIAILVAAYMRGDLNAMDCAACACGNLVAGNAGWKIKKDERHFFEDSKGNEIHANWSINGGGYQRSATGYSSEELDRIEIAFIGSAVVDGVFRQDKQNHFAGLMAVLDVLMQIHEATTEEISEAKALFVCT